jgi:hypothetical protein
MKLVAYHFRIFHTNNSKILKSATIQWLATWIFEHCIRNTIKYPMI